MWSGGHRHFLLPVKSAHATMALPSDSCSERGHVLAQIDLNLCIRGGMWLGPNGLAKGPQFDHAGQQECLVPVLSHALEFEH